MITWAEAAWSSNRSRGGLNNLVPTVRSGWKTCIFYNEFDLLG
jgi:hypothetical protein